MSRLTAPVMTASEYCALVMARARELSDDLASPTLEEEELRRLNYDTVRIAKAEIDKKSVDMVVIRTLPDGRSEEWHMSQLEKMI